MRTIFSLIRLFFRPGPALLDLEFIFLTLSAKSLSTPDQEDAPIRNKYTGLLTNGITFSMFRYNVNL